MKLSCGRREFRLVDVMKFIKTIDQHPWKTFFAVSIIFALLCWFFWEHVTRFSTVIDVVTIWFAGAIMLVSTINYLRNRSKKLLDMEEVKIILQNGDDVNSQKELAQTIIRSNLTRAELKGCLRDCHKVSGDFNIPYLGQRVFSQNLLDAQQGKTNSVLIILEVPKALGNKKPTDNFITCELK